MMDLEQRIELVSQVGEEIITPEELKEMLSKKKKYIAYDGFEPSGKMHIAQGLMRSININKMIDSGATFKMLIADWHAWANNKLGGNLENIQKAGEYFKEIWQASGMKLDNVEFIWASDVVKDENYWKLVMDIARESTLARVQRCTQIMGRSEKDTLQASQILYPCMQCADIFYLKTDVCQLGMDQRKVNMLAREIAPKFNFKKPVAVHHHMLMGLLEPPKGTTDATERAIAMKMSKSIPDSAIFMLDSEDEIQRKLKKAYCPPKQVEENPILEYAKYIIFNKFDSITIKRPEKFGGNLEIQSYDELVKEYEAGLHPLDLKQAIGEKVNELLVPVREHFEKKSKAHKLAEFMESLQVTR
ncbi:MAG: tyrosine--tRNA ligase [Candidatus Diapherotrites archaeon]|nr:tyrosine--tRNA ligase [Candidatus Diapherotrites archaeon]